ncbi:RNA-binding S4 domain-containing protein [Candidatus Ornithobacterium hominis]|uniref:RNA-binding S4 domain-containing protein n=1 Tax=Candidatus Ornithobacterium hominis TaxID=2497989 RepID=UPI0024BCAF63|nr:RNA-binding S4 domain-containing protein [Candidatus Ornithobacterium hominis]
MRIDKFLWCVRYFKTRSLATEVVKKNRVWVNGELAKPSKDVLVGDCIKLRKNQIFYEFEVLKIPSSRMGAKLVGLHIKDLTDKKQLEELKIRQTDQNYYRQKGEGRPTKKDRRELDDFMADFDDF